MTPARLLLKAAIAAFPSPEEDGRAPFTESDKGRTFENVMNVIVVWGQRVESASTKRDGSFLQDRTGQAANLSAKYFRLETVQRRRALARTAASLRTPAR
jgi:hypothetical protein